MDSGQIRLFREEAIAAVNAMAECKATVEEEHNRLMTNFDALGETFKDQYYEEYRSQFAAGASVVRNFNQDVGSLTVSLLEYVRQMLQ